MVRCPGSSFYPPFSRKQGRPLEAGSESDLCPKLRSPIYEMPWLQPHRQPSLARLLEGF